MISDTLSDAITEIDRYQRDLPDCYDDLTEELMAVKDVMYAMRVWLDSNAPDDDCKINRLLTELRSLDLSGLRAALSDIRLAAKGGAPSTPTT